MAASSRSLELGGSGLSIEELVRVARDPEAKVTCCEQALARVDRSRQLIDQVVSEYKERHRPLDEAVKQIRAARERRDGGTLDPRAYESLVASAEDRLEKPILDYGITTGFGEFKNIPIHPDELDEQPKNILLSHATGLGDDADPENLGNYFSPEVVRAVLIIRLNAFLKGHSGVRRELVEVIVKMINKGIVPLVPIHGSVGSSGDLCPLAHLFVVLLGEGRYFVVKTRDDLEPSARRKIRLAKKALEHDLRERPGDRPLPEVRVSHKEGLALTNGASFSVAMLALAVHDGGTLANTADVALAMSLEAVCGCARAFDPKVHRERGLQGQIESAANVRKLVLGSSLIESYDEVQDAYSLRCAPAVHGASRDAIAYARMVVEREINAATDNPLLFPRADGDMHEDTPWDANFEANWEQRKGYNGRVRASYSAGNFHGQPVGQAADFLAIAIAELANISERRTQMLLDAHHNRGLPANLIPHGGVNSGLMIAQYAAASLVSENKVLAHPATVDSIPTSANSEDHVAMATVACRKLLRVLRNSQGALAIELLAAAQAIAWRGVARAAKQEIPKLQKTKRVAEEPKSDSERSLQEGCEALSKPLGPAEELLEATDCANEVATLFARVKKKEMASSIEGLLGYGTRAAWRAIRSGAGHLPGVKPIQSDVLLAEPIRRVRALVESGALVTAVNAGLKKAAKQVRLKNLSPPEPGPLAAVAALTWSAVSRGPQGAG